MKKLLILSVIIALTISVFAQSPQKMSYQAVIRNSSDQLITSHAVGMQISILQGSAEGTPVYVETQTPTTNANGLVTIEIGGGTIVTGTFAGIDWSTGVYFIKTETDPTGGTSYTITGTNQILSVPYALYSKAAGNGSLWSQSGSNIYHSSGNVGIGISDPTYDLDVRGSNSDDDGVIQLGNSDLSHRIILFGGRQNDPNPFISWKQGDPLRFTTDEGGWSEKMRITSNGMVGIGTSSPTTALDVNGVITATGGNFTNDLLVNELTIGKGNGSVSSNTAIGASALPQNTTGNSNTAIGYAALNANTTGSSNTATGSLALQQNTTGDANTATGNAALRSNTEGYANSAYGHLSLTANTTGIHNTAIGYLALYSNSIGRINTAHGSAALYSNTTGSYNTAYGYQAGYNNANGNRNVFLGTSAGYYETGSNKLFIDNQSRADESDGRTKALIYGVFDADPANQVLTINGNVNVNSNKIINVADPASNKDAANKEYVDYSIKTYQVGDFAHGGIVFWIDETGQHGLVCAKTDQSTGIRWNAGTDTHTMALDDGPLAGEMNTFIIIANQGLGDGFSYAAYICYRLQITEGVKTYGDWYLPSKEELNLMYQNRTAINTTSQANGGTTFASDTYWSSTEVANGSVAWNQDFVGGGQGNNYKYNSNRVRAVRTF